MANDLKKDLHIAIAGAGMGGLACSLALAKQGFTRISVYESASNLGFVGAGIQLAPNMARILDRLGCWDDIFKEAVQLSRTSIRQGADDRELAHVDLDYVEKMYGYPHMVGHRSSLAGSLFKGCQKEPGITFHFSTTVEEVLHFNPKPSFIAKPRHAESYTVECDILLAADGVKSLIRTAMLATLNGTSSIVDTGQSAYRIMLPRAALAHDADLLALLDADTATRWIGSKRHLIAYPVSSKQIYNISTAQPDTNFAAAPSAQYTTRGDKKDMLDCYKGFCPKVQKLLDLVPEGEVCEWKLRVHAPLPTWACGSVALLGDACHPTLPHLAQGAAQAIEDAAVLGVLLARLPDAEPGTIERHLRAYESVRKERAETLVEMAAASGRALHLGESEARAERDRQFAEVKRSGRGTVPDKWADKDVQRMIYGHDCMEVAKDFDLSRVSTHA